MIQRRRYKNPPIEEAVCEFRFRPGQDWDLTIPGKLQAEMGEEYTGKPQEQRVIDFSLQSQGGSQPPSVSYGEGLAKVQLVTSDGKRKVGVGRDVLSIHMLRPYQNPSHPKRSGWDEFQPRISKALDAYWKVAQPSGVNRAGIRYINKIVVPQSRVEVEDYFKCALPNVKDLPDRLNNFMSRVEYAYSDSVRLLLSQGSSNVPQDNVPHGHVGFLLDLDVIWEHTEPVAQNKALEIANDLRNREREAFETVITDKARKLFDAD